MTRRSVANIAARCVRACCGKIEKDAYVSECSGRDGGLTARDASGGDSVGALSGAMKRAHIGALFVCVIFMSSRVSFFIGCGSLSMDDADSCLEAGSRLFHDLC